MNRFYSIQAPMEKKKLKKKQANNKNPRSELKEKRNTGEKKKQHFHF